MRELLNPQQTSPKLFDDSEEENRVSARQARKFNRDKATQAVLLLCLFVVVSLLVCF